MYKSLLKLATTIKATIAPLNYILISLSVMGSTMDPGETPL